MRYSFTQQVEYIKRNNKQRCYRSDPVYNCWQNYRKSGIMKNNAISAIDKRMSMIREKYCVFLLEKSAAR
jgi:hypothetical protein